MISDLSRSSPGEPRPVVLVGYDDAEVLDLTGPASVLAQANKLTGVEHYRLRIVAPTTRIELGAGVVMEAGPIAAVRGRVDTLIVAGGMGFDAARTDPELVSHVRRIALRSRRVTSVCSGAFLLAEAGLLDGRCATTHWAAAPYLADWYPSVTVESDRIYVRDGDVWTSAGVTSGIDLTLALLAEDLGEELAHQVARWIVLPVRRSGGQSQYSAQLAAASFGAGSSGSSTLAPLLGWMADNVDADLSVAALAERVGWGERHFTRRFKGETGRTPARHVEDLRLDAARHLLETTDLGTDAVAVRCGFASREVLHRAFQRRLDTTPARYRRTFAA